jgi:ATP-dependent DNA ligase
MRNRNLSFTFAGLAIALCALFSGCIFNQAPPQEAADAANSTAETIFQSFNTGDYGRFSENLSAPVKKNLNESSFSSMRDQIRSKYGNYTSKSAPQGSVIQGYDNIVYECGFEKGTLKVRLVMNTTNPSIVDGLWFPNGI